MQNDWVSWIIVAVSAAVCLGVLMPLYLYRKRSGETAVALTIKGVCTLVPVLVCLYGAWRAGTPAAWWMTAGLCLCLVGDVVLGIHFVAGMGAFLLGHLGYLAAFVCLAPLRWESAVVFAVLAIGVVLAFLPTVPAMGKRLVPFIVYAAVLLAMVSVAWLLPVSIGSGGWLFAIGATLFVISDLLLARNLLVRCTRLSDTVSLSFYFAGQLVLAYSVLLGGLWI